VAERTWSLAHVAGALGIDRGTVRDRLDHCGLCHGGWSVRQQARILWQWAAVGRVAMPYEIETGISRYDQRGKGTNLARYRIPSRGPASCTS